MSSRLEPRTIRLVVDTSAIVGFVRGSTSVGELIAEVDAEHGLVVVPLACLVEAAANIVDGGPWLNLLVNHRATLVVGEDPEEWGMLAGVKALLQEYELTAAAWLALKAEVDVLTRYPGRYEPLGGGPITLSFTD